jgi:hypothetical protein
MGEKQAADPCRSSGVALVQVGACPAAPAQPDPSLDTVHHNGRSESVETNGAQFFIDLAQRAGSKHGAQMVKDSASS